MNGIDFYILVEMQKAPDSAPAHFLPPFPLFPSLCDLPFFAQSPQALRLGIFQNCTIGNRPRHPAPARIHSQSLLPYTNFIPFVVPSLEQAIELSNLINMEPTCEDIYKKR